MAYSVRHNYLAIIGDSYNATETWQFGLRLVGSTEPNSQIANLLAPVVQKFWVGALPPYDQGDAIQPTAAHRLTEIKVADIDTDGSYFGDTEAYSHFYVPPIVGAGAVIQGMVPQATACVTLLTDVPRGLASKGRVFLPHNRKMDIGADGVMTAGSALQLARSVHHLVKEIAATATVGEPSVMSRGRAHREPSADGTKIIYTYPNQGVSHPITRTRCGRVVDTQRRRRRSLSEAPAVSNLL